MSGLDDLPAHRQLALIWRHLPLLGESDVDALVRACPAEPCTSRAHVRRYVGLEDPMAVRGDDGRFHLVVAGRPQCAARRYRSAWQHTQNCFWWTDGDVYRLQVPARAWAFDGKAGRVVVGQRGDRDRSWLVVLTDEVVDPSTVARRQRCPVFARVYWAAPQRDDALGRIRARLIAAFGGRCVACRSRPGAVVDHDHFTGYVRGLLCLDCNAQVDLCMHVDGCAYAAYLNDPPAAAWRLRYPLTHGVRVTDSTRAKIDALGYDPLYRG